MRRNRSGNPAEAMGAQGVCRHAWELSGLQLIEGDIHLCWGKAAACDSVFHEHKVLQESEPQWRIPLRRKGNLKPSQAELHLVIVFCTLLRDDMLLEHHRVSHFGHKLHAP